ncbi:MAG: orotidine-5'-phosphate decarboxylase [Actinobacteria bacterium]|nr:MAG: orotidine-5'-phosphate decarboxylase [Actinomycetota bacterium]
MTPFGDRLAALVAERESQIVLGLDPDPARLWPGSGDDVAAHCRAVIDAAGPACVAVKPQVACFERLGAAGWQALHETVAHARAAGLLVLADAKRGDIDISAQRYAQAFLAPGGLEADALTVSPYLGADSLAPFIDAARAAGAGVLRTCRTSSSRTAGASGSAARSSSTGSARRGRTPASAKWARWWAPRRPSIWRAPAS